MRFLHNFGVITILFILSTSCAGSKKDKPLSQHHPIDVMSFNIRYANPDDGVNRWNNRKNRVTAFIKFYHPDFLGTQEVLYSQLVDLKQALDDYKYIGVGRKDGKNEGEFSALFYNTGRFTLVENTAQTLWLSQTPQKPSKSWDAALPRIVTFGQFRDRKTGDTLWVYNTHFDHRGDVARQKSARLILKIIDRKSQGEPAILMGDFNVSEKMPPYKTLTAAGSPLKDAFYAASNAPVGPLFTFDGFAVNSNYDQKERIDFIYVNGRLNVKRYAALPTYRHGYHLSDHIPIMATVTIR